MAVRFEMIGDKVMPVVRFGEGRLNVSMCGPAKNQLDGLVISNPPAGLPQTTDELPSPVVLTFATERDIDVFIKNLLTLKMNYK